MNAELDIHSETNTPHDLIIPPLGLCEKTAPDVIGANDNGPKSKIEFYHGDCLKVMKTLPSESIDLIVTSPPYNLGATVPNWRPKGEKREPGYDGYDDNMSEEEYRIWQHKCLREMWRLLSPRGAIFYNHKPRIQQAILDTRLGLIPPEIPLHQKIVWFTRSAFHPSLHHFSSAHQLLFVLSKPEYRLCSTGASGLGDVWDIAIERNNFHPYPFPISLPQRIIETSLHNMTILDPFGGSGSTALAAKLCGKSCISIDQSAEYVGKARDRFGPDVHWQEGQVNGFDYWQTSYQHEKQLRSSSSFVLENAKKAFARTRRPRTAKDMLEDRNKVIEGINRTCEQIAVGEASPFRGWYEVRNAHAEVTLRWGQKKIELPHGEMETIVKRVDLGDYYLSLKQEVQAGNLDKAILNAKGSVKKRRKLSESKRVQMAERRKETLRARVVEASAGQIGALCEPEPLPNQTDNEKTLSAQVAPPLMESTNDNAQIVIQPEIHHGDCLEVMKTIADGSVDLILADLPYGITRCTFDKPIPLEPLWDQYRRIIKPTGAIVLFGSQPFTAQLSAANMDWLKYGLVWEKNGPTGFLQAKNKPMKSHEDILVFSPGTTVHLERSKRRMTYNPQGVTSAGLKDVTSQRSKVRFLGSKVTREEGLQYESQTGYPRSVLRFNKESDGLHPFQKPQALLEYLIRTYSNAGELVLDNVMGSGSTCIAAGRIGRRSIGIEMDRHYFDIAKQRVADELSDDWLQASQDEAIHAFENRIEAAVK